MNAELSTSKGIVAILHWIGKQIVDKGSAGVCSLRIRLRQDAVHFERVGGLPKAPWASGRNEDKILNVRERIMAKISYVL
jgi:hypothetical protein